MIVKIIAKFTGYSLSNDKEKELLSFMYKEFKFYTYRENIKQELKENHEYELEIDREVKKGEFWEQGRVFRKCKLIK